MIRYAPVPATTQACAAPVATALLAVATSLLALAPGAGAAERALELKPGDGRDLVASRCASCHSLDYVLINSPFLTAEQWQASVTKMRTFGAPLSDDEARIVVAYLASSYGHTTP